MQKKGTRKRGRSTGRHVAAGTGGGSASQSVPRRRRARARMQQSEAKNTLPNGSQAEIVLAGNPPMLTLYDTCTEPIGPTFIAAGMTPFKIFRHYFTDDVLELIVRESKRYAREVKRKRVGFKSIQYTCPLLIIIIICRFQISI